MVLSYGDPLLQNTCFQDIRFIVAVGSITRSKIMGLIFIRAFLNRIAFNHFLLFSKQRIEDVSYLVLLCILSFYELMEF